MIQFVDHRLLLYTGPAGGVTNVNRGNRWPVEGETPWPARCHASVVTIVASWLVDLNLLVVSPWTLEACFYNYTVKVPVQPVSLVF